MDMFSFLDLLISGAKLLLKKLLVRLRRKEPVQRLQRQEGVVAPSASVLVMRAQL